MKTIAVSIIICLAALLISSSAAFAGPLVNVQEFQDKVIANAERESAAKTEQQDSDSLIQWENNPGNQTESADINSSLTSVDDQ